MTITKWMQKTLLLVSLLSTFAFAGPVNINSADAKTLAKNLNGIGEKRAEAIVEYRNANGPFKTLLDLQKVKGVGKSVTESNLQLIQFK